MISLHKITELQTLDNYVLLVSFGDEKKSYDLKPLIAKYDIFQELINVPSLYKQAKIDIGGYGIVWNDMLDLSAETVYQNGIAA